MFDYYPFVPSAETELLYEAEQLLEEVVSWSEEEVEALPKWYREEAKRYRRLAKVGEA